MYQFFAKIYHYFSHFAFIRKLGQMYRNGFPIGNLLAYFRMKKISRVHKHPGETVRIVFCGQYLPVWNKIKTVVDQAIKDDRFEVWILAIPDIVTKVEGNNYLDLKEIYGDRVINAQQGDEWFSLEGLKPDYVFFQRPYDTYLPECYRSKTVSKYAKICYLNYGYNFTDIYKLSMAKIFFRNVSLFFAEADEYKRYNENRFAASHRRGYQKSFSLGYPAFQEFMEHRQAEEKDHTFRIIWTPRWSEDVEVGGTNFFRYKDKVVEYVKQHENASLIFRPHPMLFSHSLEVGRMSQQDVDGYLRNFQGRLEYDAGKQYADNFWRSDVMLTDFSSVIMEYFLTGKPIVFCPSSIQINDFFRDILSVNYVAETWEEAENILSNLASGIDPYREAREKKAAAFLGDYPSVSKRILNAIAEDCWTVKGGCENL